MTVDRAGQNNRQLNRNAPQMEFTSSRGYWVYLKFHVQTRVLRNITALLKENVKELRNINVPLGFGRYEVFSRN